MIEVRVIKQDIDRGDIGNSHACPIALALKRELSPRAVRVAESAIILNGASGLSMYQYFACSDEVRKWITLFDSSLKVKPITIVLDQSRSMVYVK